MQRSENVRSFRNICCKKIGKIYSKHRKDDVRLSDGRVGKVILINDSALHKPVVQVDGEYIDLSKKKDLSITALL